jgi:hypothetical protein
MLFTGLLEIAIDWFFIWRIEMTMKQVDTTSSLKRPHSEPSGSHKSKGSVVLWCVVEL